MSRLMYRKAQLNPSASVGVVPIQCGWDDQNCVAQGYDPWGYGIGLPHGMIAPPFQTVNLGDSPIDNPPLNQGGLLTCDKGLALVNGVCVQVDSNGNPIKSFVTPMTANGGPSTAVSVSPVIANNLQTTIDSLITKAEANPLIALGIAGLLIFAITRK